VIQCPKCLNPVEDDAKFCGYCATPLKGATPSAGQDADPFVGKCINNKYCVKERIGTGGMGVVYLATQKGVDQNVAIKKLHASLYQDKSIVGRFINEARSYGRISHPNAVRLYDLLNVNGEICIVMEYVRGKTLTEYLDAQHVFTMRQILVISLQLADALWTVHREGIIHRDLKTDNIMLLETVPGRFSVKILDFGIAKMLDAPPDRTTEQGLIVGTPEFMSPEQCYGQAVDARTDIYSFGILLYAMITNRLPFINPSKVGLMHMQVSTPVPEMARIDGSEVLPGLEAIVRKCMEKLADDRYQTFADVIADLTCLQDGVETKIAKPARSSATLPAQNTDLWLPQEAASKCAHCIEPPMVLSASDTEMTLPQEDSPKQSAAFVLDGKKDGPKQSAAFVLDGKKDGPKQSAAFVLDGKKDSPKQSAAFVLDGKKDSPKQSTSFMLGRKKDGPKQSTPFILGLEEDEDQFNLADEAPEVSPSVEIEPDEDEDGEGFSLGGEDDGYSLDNLTAVSGVSRSVSRHRSRRGKKSRVPLMVALLFVAVLGGIGLWQWYAGRSLVSLSGMDALRRTPPEAPRDVPKTSPGVASPSEDTPPNTVPVPLPEPEQIAPSQAMQRDVFERGIMRAAIDMAQDIVYAGEVAKSAAILSRVESQKAVLSDADRTRLANLLALRTDFEETLANAERARRQLRCEEITRPIAQLPPEAVGMGDKLRAIARQCQTAVARPPTTL